MTTMALSWWMPGTGGSKQAIIKNYQGAQESGLEIDLFLSNSFDSLVSRAGEYDFAFLPYCLSPNVVSAVAERTHVHLQIGGYNDDSDWGAADAAIDAADTVSVIDPQLYTLFSERTNTLNQTDVYLVPNAPNEDMFSPLEPDDEEYILIPKIGNGDRSIQPASPEIVNHGGKFLAFNTGNFEGEKPSNISLHPAVPLSWMPEVYRNAKAVYNLSRREGLPNVCFESFLTETPYVAPFEQGIGELQAYPEPPIEAFGRKVDYFLYDMPQWDYEDMDHFATSLDDVTPETGEKGREWVEEWVGEWTWEDKFDTIESIVSNSQ